VPVAGPGGGDRGRVVRLRRGVRQGRCTTDATRGAGGSGSTSLVSLYLLQVLAKGFNVFYFVLLTVLYGQGVISSDELGWIGAVFIGLLIVGAVFVARWLHELQTKRLLQLSAAVAMGASTVLFVGVTQHGLPAIVGSYAAMGLAVGIAMSGVNAMAAGLTKRGNRFKSMAKLSMYTDLARMAFPLVVAGAVAVGETRAAVVVIVAAAAIFFGFSSRLPRLAPDVAAPAATGGEGVDIRQNHAFLYILSLEFFDSFASSQLFVFLPLLFLAKGFSLSNSLLLQSCIFLGYLSGRVVVTQLAKWFSGMRAVAYTEMGMVVCIAALLVTSATVPLYALSFLLGIFSRGTSPAIKALAFDALEDHQVKKGSALHVVGGDSGSAMGQLLFGLLVAWFGINTPFLVAAVVAGIIALACLREPVKAGAPTPAAPRFTVLASGRARGEVTLTTAEFMWSAERAAPRAPAVAGPPATWEGEPAPRPGLPAGPGRRPPVPPAMPRRPAPGARTAGTPPTRAGRPPEQGRPAPRRPLPASPRRPPPRVTAEGVPRGQPRPAMPPGQDRLAPPSASPPGRRPAPDRRPPVRDDGRERRPPVARRVEHQLPPHPTTPPRLPGPPRDNGEGRRLGSAPPVNRARGVVRPPVSANVALARVVTAYPPVEALPALAGHQRPPCPGPQVGGAMSDQSETLPYSEGANR
jgi:MFS family permease